MKYLTKLAFGFRSFFNKRSHFVGNHFFFQEAQISDLEVFAELIFVEMAHLIYGLSNKNSLEM